MAISTTLNVGGGRTIGVATSGGVTSAGATPPPPPKPIATPGYFAQDEGSVGPAPTAPVVAVAPPAQAADTFTPSAADVTTVLPGGAVTPSAGTPSWVWLVAAGIVLWMLVGSRKRR